MKILCDSCLLVLEVQSGSLLDRLLQQKTADEAAENAGWFIGLKSNPFTDGQRVHICPDCREKAGKP